jgi:hypothetical protein
MQMQTIPFTYQALPGTLEIQGTNVFVRWGGASFQKEAAVGPLAITIDQAIAAQEERDRNTRTHYASMSRAARRRFLDD